MNTQISAKLLVQHLQQIPGIKVELTGAIQLGEEAGATPFTTDVLFQEWASYWLSAYKAGIVKDNTEAYKR